MYLFTKLFKTEPRSNPAVLLYSVFAMQPQLISSVSFCLLGTSKKKKILERKFLKSTVYKINQMPVGCAVSKCTKRARFQEAFAI